jgi:hypothetical protein
MKAFNGSIPRRAGRAGLILLLTEKLVIDATVTDRRYNNPDEHNQIGILTSGLTSLPPSRSCDQWPWEFVTRYSGATVPGFHGVPRHLTVT